jgi:hypothetical protein
MSANAYAAAELAKKAFYYPAVLHGVMTSSGATIRLDTRYDLKGRLEKTLDTKAVS